MYGGHKGIYPQPVLSQVLAKSPCLLGSPGRDIGPWASGEELGRCWLDVLPTLTTPLPRTELEAWSPWESVPTVKVTLLDA